VTREDDPRRREHVALLHQAAAKVRADGRWAQANLRIDPGAVLALAVLFDECEWAVGRSDLKPSSVRRSVVELATRISTGTGE
jgi:hypothetical protein